MTLPSVGLVEAARDPRLLGASLTLWAIQERLLELAERYRLSVWCLGRRSSKSTTSALVALWCCLLRPELLERLRPGERGYAIVVSTNHRQSRLVLQAALSIVRCSPVLAELLVSETEDELVFRVGDREVALAAFPCTSRGGRGWPVFCLVLDEAAHFLSESDGFQTADRVWEALAPSTAQFGHLSRVIICSTPYGSDGFFADMFERAASGQLPDAVAVQASTSESNPTISNDFLEAERARDPESFLGEYGAQFLGSGNAYLDLARIEECVVDRPELTPASARGWIAGLDPAFSSDPFGLALVGRDLEGSGRLTLGLVRSWKPHRSEGTFEQRRAREDEVLTEVAALCRNYKARVVTDQYAAPAIVDRLTQAGLSVSTLPMTAGSKTQAYSELRARLYTGGLELYQHDGLIAELRRLRSRYTAGAASVVNPRVGGSHGDMAQALAISVAEHDRYGIARGIGWTPREPQPDDRAIVRLAELDRVIEPRRRDPSRRPKWYDRDDDLRTMVF